MQKIISNLLLSAVFVMLLLTLLAMGAVVQAAEMDHSKMDHGAMSQASMAQYVSPPVTTALEKLSVMPASGKAREGGADGRYVMESTSVFDSMAEQCAKASRGLVMLDNASWLQCGGKQQGAASTSAVVTGDHAHAGHSMP